MMCWFTGYIFDTFNELIQMFYARKDSPSIIAAALSTRLPFKRRAQAPSAALASCPRAEGWAIGSTPAPTRPPSLPWAECVRWVFAAAICARRWRSVIYTHCSH